MAHKCTDCGVIVKVISSNGKCEDCEEYDERMEEWQALESAKRDEDEARWMLQRESFPN